MAILGALMLTLLFVFTTTAQEEDEGGTADHMMEALALIPDTVQTRTGILSYADYRAMEAARPGVPSPGSFDELDDLLDTDTGGLWLAALFGISSGSIELLQNFRIAYDLPRIIGIDFFQVDQSVEYGNPPERGIMLLGRFDVEAVQAALTERDYEATEIEHGTIWCGPVGCENGTQTDLQGREPSNPFGGQFGQQQPLLISESYLIGSSQLNLVENHASVIAGDAPSLADAPAYAVIAAALDEDNILIQAQFLQPGDIAQSMAGLLGSLTSEQREEFYEDVAENFVPFAPYELIAFTDSASETEQVVQVMLVYSNAENAQTAADAIPERILNYTSYQHRIPFTELLEEREMQVATSVYTNDDLGRAVTIVSFTAPLAESAVDEESGRFTQSSMAYRLLVQMIYARDLDWLVPELLLLEEIIWD